MKTWWACDLHEKSKVYHSCDRPPVCEEVIRKADAEEEIEREKVESFNRGWEVGRLEGRPGTAEIEKARRQGAIEQEAKCEAVTETIRADERERIRKAVKELRPKGYSSGWAYALNDVEKILGDERDQPAQEPKPLTVSATQPKIDFCSQCGTALGIVEEPKPLEHVEFRGPEWIDQISVAFNILVDAVQGIQNWIARHDT